MALGILFRLLEKQKRELEKVILAMGPLDLEVGVRQLSGGRRGVRQVGMGGSKESCRLGSSGTRALEQREILANRPRKTAPKTAENGGRFALW